MFAGGEAASRELARHYAEVCRPDGLRLLRRRQRREDHAVDGVHLDAENTRAIGRALAPVVRKMLEF